MLVLCYMRILISCGLHLAQNNLEFLRFLALFFLIGTMHRAAPSASRQWVESDDQYTRDTIASSHDYGHVKNDPEAIAKHVHGDFVGKVVMMMMMSCIRGSPACASILQ